LARIVISHQSLIDECQFINLIQDIDFANMEIDGHTDLSIKNAFLEVDND